MNPGLGIGHFAGVFAGDGPGGLASAEPAFSATSAQSGLDRVSGRATLAPPSHRGHALVVGEAVDAGGPA